MSAPSSYATAQQLFLADLVKNLYQNNAFLQRSRNWNGFAKGKTVNWNQSGAKPGVIINRDSTNLTPAKRTDVLRNYNLDEYQTQPTILDWTEEMVINYNKRADVIDDHVNTVTEDLADRIVYRWAAGASALLRTTGTARPAKTPSATGTRLAVTFADFVAVMERFAEQNINGELNALLPSGLLTDIFGIDEFISNDYLQGNAMPVVNGTIGKLLNFNIFVRGKGIVYNNAATPVAQLPKADDTAAARTPNAADNQSILFWSSDNVTRSISPDSLTSVVPVHGGVELSATLIAGGAPFRNSGEGIVALVEANGV